MRILLLDLLVIVLKHTDILTNRANVQRGVRNADLPLTYTKMAEIFLPKWKNGNGSQFMRNLDRYLRYEVDKEKSELAMREAQCRKVNRDMGSAKMEGVGQLKGTIPARDFFRWQQFKPGCWGDKSFVKEYFRDNPSFKAQTLTKKSFSGPSFKAA